MHHERLVPASPRACPVGGEKCEGEAKARPRRCPSSSPRTQGRGGMVGKCGEAEGRGIAPGGADRAEGIASIRVIRDIRC